MHMRLCEWVGVCVRACVDVCVLPSGVWVRVWYACTRDTCPSFVNRWTYNNVCISIDPCIKCIFVGIITK